MSAFHGHHSQDISTIDFGITKELLGRQLVLVNDQANQKYNGVYSTSTSVLPERGQMCYDVNLMCTKVFTGTTWMAIEAIDAGTERPQGVAAEWLEEFSSREEIQKRPRSKNISSRHVSPFQERSAFELKLEARRNKRRLNS